ncbi:MAG: hypothetical protein H9533_07415 [Rhodobacteraceae bacterium]|nr:hypothetical protein [Paracoccaceae bacterium]
MVQGKTGLEAGDLAAEASAANLPGRATTESHRILYETDTGRLYFDADGTGAAGRVQIATLVAGLDLTEDAFFIF